VVTVKKLLQILHDIQNQDIPVIVEFWDVADDPMPLETVRIEYGKTDSVVLSPAEEIA
jgi:hypothetical protein